MQLGELVLDLDLDVVLDLDQVPMALAAEGVVSRPPS